MKENIEMKKLYTTPELNARAVQAKDAVTMSFEEEGTPSSYSFKDIVDGKSDWTVI